MSRLTKISRRTALRGLGVSIALPLLDAMGSRRPLLSALSEAQSAPLRVAFLYVPNGVHMPAWTPHTAGSTFALPPILEPLQAVKDDIAVLSGLALDPARAHGDGGGDHARAMASFLTANHPQKTGGANLRAGVSVDQLAAQQIGAATRFPSLEIGCEGSKNAGECDHGYSCAYQSNLSWRNETTPVAKQVNPRLVFDRLFGDPQGTESDSARSQRRDKSVLDFVGDDTRRLSQTLGSADRRKLDEYLTSVREIERRVTDTRPAIDLGVAKVNRPLGIRPTIKSTCEP